MKLGWKNILVILVLLHMNDVVSGQDIHFSQFEMAPMNYNPALAGQFDGDYRFIVNQRTQWKSVTIPYSTLGGSVDARNFLAVDGLGTGLSIYRDIAGDSHFNTLQVNAAGSFLIPVSKDSLQTFSGGLHLGMTNKKIDYSDLNYDTNWNGVAYDPDLLNPESFDTPSLTSLNLNLGLAYFNKVDERKKFTVGIALFNLNHAKQSYFSDDEVRLNTRLNIHANALFKINDEYDVMPSVLFQKQGELQEFILGGNLRKIMMNTGGLFRTVFGGLYYRTKDAGFLMAGIDYDNWRFGVSYDINLSDLRPASHGRGGFEFGLVYIIRKANPTTIKYKYCPDYL